MATKIKLGDRPKHFKRIVKFPMLDGTEGAIEMNYKYRTRTEFGKFIDGIIAAAGSTTKADDEAFSMATLMAKTGGANADYVMQVADGWNLEETDFTLANIQQLADEIPAAVNAIMETYRTACVEGRLGN